MTLSQMRYFQAVCKFNSVSKAAENLYISQPAISAAIRDLEAEFGIQLFHRLNKQLILTVEGNLFLTKVDELLPEIDNLSLQMREIGRKSNVKMSILPIAGSYIFPKILSCFRMVDPEIRINIKECGMHQVYEKIGNGEYDFSMIIVDTKRRDSLEGLVLLKTEYMFCVNPSHPLAEKKEIDIESLVGEPLILFQDNTYLTTEVKRRFFQLGLVPNIIFYANRLSLIKELLVSGKEGVFLTREAAESQEDIVGIPLSRSIPVSFALVWEKHRHKHRDMIKLIQFLKERFPVSSF
jgi:DNA-binding transcriptional LysR family regulator